MTENNIIAEFRAKHGLELFSVAHLLEDLIRNIIVFEAKGECPLETSEKLQKIESAPGLIAGELDRVEKLSPESAAIYRRLCEECVAALRADIKRRKAIDCEEGI